MRSSVLVMVWVAAAGCAVDATTPDVIDDVTVDRVEPQLPLVEVSPDVSADIRGPDTCALAAALPADDICSLACDPPAMAARLEADGSDKGFCYQLWCQLSETEHVLVGVCLPP